METKTTWTRLNPGTTGHRLYRDEKGRIAIADDSIRDAKDPSTTDDGLLLVSTDQPMYLRYVKGCGVSANIGVVKKNGESCVCGIALFTARDLARHCGMKLHVEHFGIVEPLDVPSKQLLPLLRVRECGCFYLGTTKVYDCSDSEFGIWTRKHGLPLPDDQPFREATEEEQQSVIEFLERSVGLAAYAGQINHALWGIGRILDRK